MSVFAQLLALPLVFPMVTPVTKQSESKVAGYFTRTVRRADAIVRTSTYMNVAYVHCRYGTSAHHVSF